jgi:integrase/recombinase XerD
MNISDHSTKLRNYMEFRKYAEASTDNYVCCFEKFLGYFENKGIAHPSKINSEMIIDFLSQFKEPSTHSGYHSAIKMYYSKVAKIGIEKFKYIERPRRSQKLPIILAVDEIQRMFDVCENKKHKVILALLYSCSLRVSELINLKWCHIDKARMIINIIQAKGNKDRQVALNDILIGLLYEYHADYKSKEYVLNGQKSTQYSERSVGEVVKQLAAKAGITKDVHTHLIRHTSATHMVENGIDINLIQKILGHSNVKTTNIYLHISDKHISKIPSPLQSINFRK